MKYFIKIFFGSFFRTLVKIFAFIIVGIILAFFFNFINIGNVSANTGSGWGIDMRFDGTLQFHDSNKVIKNLVGQQVLYTIGNTNHFATYQTVQTGTASKFNIALLSQFLANNVYYINYYVCTENGHYSNVSSSYGGFNDIRNFSNQNLVYSKIQDAPVSNMPITNSQVTFGDCSIYTQVIVPKVNNEWVSLNFENTLSNQKLAVFGVEITTGGMYSSTTNEDIKTQVQDMQSSINNNIDDMKQKQQETNDTIKDDNVDTSQASGFFDSFDNIDHGGISGVVTAPLTAINKINQSCSPISINLWDTDISLPCGDTLFWNKENVSSFRTVWNVLIGGPLIYALMLKLFHVIQNLKNPDDSRVEVAKL